MFGYIFDCIKSIWDVMSDVFVINFYNSSLSLAEFLVGLIVSGIILSIFLSFVNVNNIRTSYSRAEFNNWNNSQKRQQERVRTEKRVKAAEEKAFKSADDKYLKQYNQMYNYTNKKGRR